MPGNDFTLDINPAVLRWARESAGQSTAAVAERLKVSSRTVDEWESGRRALQWKSLRKLAREYQRPVAALLLAQPPDEPELPADYRTLPESKRELSSPTRLAIRTAHWLQERAVELHEQLGREARFPDQKNAMSQAPEKLAAAWRNELGIGVEEQLAWADNYEAYRRWRTALEERDILVFQFRFPLEELRGFSLFDPIVPVIATSESDFVQARIFTLFHELAHLLVQQPGLCLPNEIPPPRGMEIETYCNRFSAAFLVPPSEVRTWELKVLAGHNGETERNLKGLARRYHVSKYVILGRLRAEQRLAESQYRQISRHWAAQDDARAAMPRKPARGGQTAVRICGRQRGRAFISLVLEAAEKGVITTHDAVTYLGVKTKDLPKLESLRE